MKGRTNSLQGLKFMADRRILGQVFEMVTEMQVIAGKTLEKG